jgi:hypothetical protein
MENFAIAKAIGFVLAGILIAIFSSRQALFWGGTLVVSAFIGYANPIWGVITFFQLAAGWMIGRWLVSLPEAIRFFFLIRKAQRMGDSTRPKPKPTEIRAKPPPPSPPIPPPLPPQTPQTKRRGSTVIFLSLGAIVAGLFFVGLTRQSPRSEPHLKIDVSDRTETRDSAGGPEINIESEEPVTEPTLNERLAMFSHEDRIVVRVETLTAAEVMIVTSPVERDPKIHRLFVIDCAIGAYSKNAESLELAYLFDVIDLLSQGEPFTKKLFTQEDVDPEANKLYKMACGGD